MASSATETAAAENQLPREQLARPVSVLRPLPAQSRPGLGWGTGSVLWILTA